MSHYLEDGEARATDRLALAPLAAADARGLYDAVRAHDITMCGYIPATVALVAARALGATRATVVGYATSADAGADPDRVVGYAAVRVDA
jgi:AmmeMemoRadiSam system protein B